MNFFKKKYGSIIMGAVGLGIGFAVVVTCAFQLLTSGVN